MLYLFCGFTDMIDGTIARKAGAVSEFGARLDTASDFIFLFAVLWLLGIAVRLIFRADNHIRKLEE